jgi:hypothetical protein
MFQVWRLREGLHMWTVTNEITRSCVANPAGFMDGVTVAVLTLVIITALAIRRNNR